MNETFNWITVTELYAIVAALLLGWGLTEALKRLMRLITWRQPPWLYPLVGYLSTSIAAFILWPSDGKFPHRIIAALIVGSLAPMIYKLITAGLRRYGFDWAANALTGERRRRRIVRPPGNVERRQS